MKPYYILKNIETLEVAIQYSESPLENSIEYSENFVKALFDCYPNPTQVIEGITEKEIEAYKLEQIEALNIEYTNKIDELVSVHVQKFITRGIAIPKDILEQQQELINEFKKKYENF